MSELQNSFLLSSSLGQKHQVPLFLKKLLETKRVPQAIVFCGPKGRAVDDWAFFYALWILCENKKKDQPCFECSSCQKVKSNQHEDFFLIQPDLSSVEVIKISQVKPIQEALHLKSWSQRRVFLILSSDKLNSFASNSLLKNLEEPPIGSHFILTSLSPQSLLSTLRSRCQIVSIPPFSVEDLKLFYPNLKDWSYLAAYGDKNRLQEWNDEETDTFLQKAFQFLKYISMGQPGQFLLDSEVTQWTQQDFIKWLCCLNLILRDLMIQEHAASFLILKSFSTVLKEYREIFDFFILNRLYSSIQFFMKSSLRTPFDRQLMLEQMCYQMGSFFEKGESRYV